VRKCLGTFYSREGQGFNRSIQKSDGSGFLGYFGRAGMLMLLNIGKYWKMFEEADLSENRMQNENGYQKR